MIVGYACGDGLGHLTRLRAAVHTLGLPGPVTVITGSGHAGDPRVTGDWSVLPVPRPLTRERVAGLLRELEPTTVVVDAFPAGLDGELDADVVPAGTRVVQLARYLVWERYAPLLPARPLGFDQVWQVEPLDPRHLAHLRSGCPRVEPLRLADPPGGPAPAGPVEPGLVEPGLVEPGLVEPGLVEPGLVEPGTWLVVHGGPDAEVLELVGYALDTAALEGERAPVVLISPRLPDGLPAAVRHLDVYPATALFPLAGRIVTAAGFNAVRQAQPWRDRHRMIPFRRRYDDQFRRAAAARPGPAGAGAPSDGAT